MAFKKLMITKTKLGKKILKLKNLLKSKCINSLTAG